MKSICMIMVVALLVAAPLSVWSQETGASLYKSKCAVCHGDKGEGKPAMKAPAVTGTKLTAEELATYLTKGETGKTYHANPVSGVSAAQAQLVTDFVKALKP